MNRRIAGLLMVCLAPPGWTAWQFAEPLEIAPAKPGVFHHLDASGRQSLAVSAGRVAITWEDNRGGAPRCYVAIGRPPALREFRFGQADCFELGIAALGGGRFALIWSETAGIHVALADGKGVKPATRLATTGTQGVLAYHPRPGLFAAWGQAEGRWQRLYTARLAIRGGRIATGTPGPVDKAAPQDAQMYPALAAGAAGICIAWEDRRKGHTAIYASWSRDGTHWAAPSQVNEGSQAQSNIGRGTGAMRPTLAPFGRGRSAAVWLDKRDFLAGYDVYAALSEDGGERFGGNIKAQDSFGDAIAQWHAAVAGNAKGDLAVAWDDDRDGNPDIWLTWLTPQGFAENISPPPAHTKDSQTDPVLALDAPGNLHLAWIERGPDDSSRIRYLFGRRLP
ncbi:MAG: hypothetical protein HY850_01590 [Betaproteobacteria bacterium]|nr:hypothetical protein [Betaproteobacteria bacterium]